MVLPGMLRDVATALDRIENYIGGDRTIDPTNTLNGIWITLTTVRGHMQRVADDATNSQNLLNTANIRLNNLMNDYDVLLRREQMVSQAWMDER